MQNFSGKQYLQNCHNTILVNIHSVHAYNVIITQFLDGRVQPSPLRDSGFVL